MTPSATWLPLWQEVAHNLAHRPVLALLAMGMVVLVAGWSAQVLAFRLGIPGIILLLLTGILLGPDGIGLVHMDAHRIGLRAIIAGSVAVIVFESVLRIDLHDLRRVSRPVLALSTVGVAITTGLASLIAWRLFELPPEVALLFGAIVSITGPTVIIPIVRRLGLGPSLKTTLEGESVFADAVGVILAASIFGHIQGNPVYATNGAALFVGHLALGALVGAAIAGAGRWLIERLSPLPGEYVRLGVLGTALMVYVCAELVSRQLGIMAVAVAALVFVLRPLPYTETIKQFKGDLTMICLSLVFILLAAGLPIRDLFQLGWRGVAVVALLMLVVRPICVFVATLGSELTWREKAFLAVLGPRGIVAASAATYFALELNAQGIAGGDTLKGLVFLVVFFTVTLQGGGAPWTARWLGVIPPKVVFLGGDKAVRRHAETLLRLGQPVQLFDESLDNVHQLLVRNLPAKLMRLGDVQAVLQRCNPTDAREVIVATASDERNLALATVLRERYPELPLAVRLQGADADARLAPLHARAWQPPTDAATLGPGGPESIIEITLHNPELTGVPLAELDVPPGSTVVAIRREGLLLVPRGTNSLALGDVVTVRGEVASVEQTRAMLERG